MRSVIGVAGGWKPSCHGCGWSASAAPPANANAASPAASANYRSRQPHHVPQPPFGEDPLLRGHPAGRPPGEEPGAAVRITVPSGIVRASRRSAEAGTAPSNCPRRGGSNRSGRTYTKPRAATTRRSPLTRCGKPPHLAQPAGAESRLWRPRHRAEVFTPHLLRAGPGLHDSSAPFKYGGVSPAKANVMWRSFAEPPGTSYWAARRSRRAA